MGDFEDDCTHLEMINDVTPSSADQCLQCVEMGDEWVHLRLCMICGQVGCCDNSKNTHATKHYHDLPPIALPLIISDLRPAEA